MTEAEFKARTKQIALRIIHLVESLPNSSTANVIGKQLLRSGTSIGANYRAACRAKSRADLAHKLSIVEEEADESLYWIELLTEAKLIAEKKISVLMSDIGEVLAMTVASIKTLRQRTVVQSKIQNLKSKISHEGLDCPEHDSRRWASRGYQTSRDVRIARERFSRDADAA